MYNDSIETLLLRHYGNNGPTPEVLEQRLYASVQQQVRETKQEQAFARSIRQQRISRRRAIQVVAVSTAGLGLLSAGIASVKTILTNQDGSQHAYSS